MAGLGFAIHSTSCCQLEGAFCLATWPGQMLWFREWSLSTYQTLWRLVSDHKLHSGFLKVVFPNPFRLLLWFKLLNCQLAQESHQSCRQLKKEDIIGDTQILRSSDMNAMYIYTYMMIFPWSFHSRSTWEIWHKTCDVSSPPPLTNVDPRSCHMPRHITNISAWMMWRMVRWIVGCPGGCFSRKKWELTRFMGFTWWLYV